jgi:very-long-chain enoyl-CoA reductase
LLNPLFLELSFLVWGNYEPSNLQMCARRSLPTSGHSFYADRLSTFRNLTIFHFIKRFLESAFVHRFSRATVPLTYVFRK